MEDSGKQRWQNVAEVQLFGEYFLISEPRDLQFNYFFENWKQYLGSTKIVGLNLRPVEIKDVNHKGIGKIYPLRKRHD